MLLGTRNQKQSGLEHLTNPQAYDQVQRRQKQKQLLDLINDKDQTITILHHVNTRLGAQLAILQKKLGIDNQNIIRELQNLKQISVGFHYQIQHLEYLDHLFKAYDQNNLKQKKLIALLYSQLEDSQKKAQNLVRDNEFLLNQMQQKCKQILQIYQKGFPQDNLIQTYNKLQRQTQQNLTQTMRQQNEYLTKYSQQLEEKYLKLQVQYEDARINMEKYYQSYKQQSEQIKDTYIKCDDLIKVKQVLEKKFDQISQQNIQLESAKQLLQTKVTKLQQQIKNTKNQFFTLKKSSRQDVDKIQSDLDTLKIQHQTTSKRQRQSFNKQMIFQREIQSLRDSNRNLKRQLQKTKSDFQNTIKMLQAYQTKITNNQKKMKAMKQFVDENKQNLDQLILEKDKAQLKIQQVQKENQSLRNKYLDQSSLLKTSFEKIINNLNQKVQVLEQTKEDLAADMHQRQVSMRNQNQKLKRVNNQLRAQNSNLLHSMKSSSGSQIITKIRELQQKNQNLNRLVSQSDKKHYQQCQLKQQQVQNLQQQLRDLSRQLQKQRSSTSSSIRQITQLKSRLSIVQNQKQCQQNQLNRMKRIIDQKSIHNQEQRDWKIKQLEQKLTQAQQKEKLIRRQAIQKLQKYDQTQRELQMEYKNVINTLQREIQELKRKLKKKN